MSLASIPGSATDVSTSPVDAYLLEVYRQAAESNRPSAGRRIRGMGAFLAFVGLVTAALALLFAVPEGESGPLIPVVCVTLGVLGLMVSIAFYALEIHRQHGSRGTARADAHSEAAASLYQASIGFFGFAIVIGTALQLVR